MFPSTTNANLFPHLSPSDHHQLSPPPFLGQNAADIFLHHHHHDLLMSDFLSADSSVTETLFGMFISDKSAITNQESNELNGHDFGPKDNLAPEKTAPKKVTHRKIYTAQGLRDRRVRLSIEIARKFFDLQDMLGFQKASKTIDWLLANSKKEIKDLMNKVKNCSSTTTAGGGGVKSSSLSSASQGEVVAGTYNIGVVSKMKKLKSVCKGKKVKLQKDRATLDHLLVSREARARARARARERTREKILRSKLKTSPIVSDEQKIS
ncbi:hypothetical protein Vadar_001596 [Vaccinium darrowii]|uniref:Uncharacterized protein n=1 Tax=Vaccinium darrowii TaxID=229202 RepID=A0ACB7XWQ4_9ERIC|nr:hypothetical protein Vadar_001596 [Vaccinium darrowii]